MRTPNGKELKKSWSIWGMKLRLSNQKIKIYFLKRICEEQGVDRSDDMRTIRIIISILFIILLSLPVVILCIRLLGNLSELCFPQWISWITSERNLFPDSIFAITALIVLGYTFYTWKTVVELRTSQNLNTLGNLTRYYDDIRDVRSKIFRNSGVTNEERTRLCNFLDGFGHITYKLAERDQDMVIGRWSETLIRSWIRLGKFVEKKRKKSIGRDYCFFEWLASKSFDYHKNNFSSQKIHFYEFQGEEDFDSIEAWELHDEGGAREFRLIPEGTKVKEDQDRKITFLNPKEVEKKYLREM
jgi:hypothetical protein